MKRQYYFLLLIAVMLYLFYLTINIQYKDYKINYNIHYMKDQNLKLSTEIGSNKDFLTYISTNSYVDKILKEEQGLKNKAEEVIFFTSQETIRKYSQKQDRETISHKTKNIYDNMTPPQKWVYFIFKKDLR